MTSESALYVGSVMHQRLRPVRHRLDYRLFSLLLDLDELADLDRRLRLFSLDRFNLFSLHQADYGDGRGLRAHVERQLAAAGLPIGGPIRLLSMPRILGHAFNPLSVYFCLRPDGVLQAILYEVNNTFGERHGYLIPVDEAEARGERIRQQCDKRFHVSPFLGLEMRYDFRVTPPRADRATLALGVSASDEGGALLHAHLEAQRRPLGDAALLRVFFTHPLLTLKVVAGIHWEAAKLFMRGLRLHARPAPPATPVSITKARDP
ncbi:DUF1365 family protein [Variovorax sp. J31P207]|uniref:DUF1365 domain-containing protein n=1 Tax=Variovorax sp. J31P207 TaxID=3053510 RepID=UPI0025754C7C|nr:DUF1365 family protein [Variovorax sp. J31P207]MDM0068757.1 DUF1365 family protein [Variovorax sp. J31P207]